MRKQVDLKAWLERWSYSDRVKQRTAPFLYLLLKDKTDEFVKDFLIAASQVISDVRCDRISPEEADGFFTLIDLFAAEAGVEEDLPEPIIRLIGEGILFHDHGTEFGPDLDWMENTIKEYVAEIQRRPT